MTDLESTQDRLPLLEALEAHEWLERSLLGKAARKASILDDDGFVKAILRVGRILKDEVRLSIDTKEFALRVRQHTDLDWKGASEAEQKKAVTELVNLMRGLPSRFAPGVEAKLKDAGRRVAGDTAAAVATKQKLRVDPSFVQRDWRAIDALAGSSAVFFQPEYDRVGVSFRERAQKTIAEGLEKGHGRVEIAADLRAEFREGAVDEDYWETCAAVHVARARSFSSAATYAEAGVTEYEIVVIDDERTTPLCRSLIGKRFSVEATLNHFDALEGAKSLDEVKARLAPFGELADGVITLSSGAELSPDSSAAELQAAGLHAPPLHYRCRSSMVPVISETPIQPGETPGAPGEVPKAPKKPRAPRKPKVPEARTPESPGPRRVGKTPEEARAETLALVREGVGFIPGELPDEYGSDAMDYWGLTAIGPGGREKVREISRALSDELSKEFVAIGKKIVDADPKLSRVWTEAVGLRGSGTPAEIDGQDNVAFELVRALRHIGADTVKDPKERKARREAFAAEVESKLQMAELDVANDKFKPSGKPVDGDSKKWMRMAAEDAWDAWGPLAEEAMRRNKTVFRCSSNDRAHNSSLDEYFAADDAPTFHHELGHSIENHATAPREQRTYNVSRGEASSYWRSRIEQRDSAPARKLSEVTGSSGYGPSEVTKRDKWGDAYMGKTYTGDDSTEVVAMFSELFGGRYSRFARQFREDPTVLLEFAGYMKSLINGEIARRARVKAAMTLP